MVACDPGRVIMWVASVGWRVARQQLFLADNRPPAFDKKLATIAARLTEPCESSPFPRKGDDVSRNKSAVHPSRDIQRNLDVPRRQKD